MCSLCTHIGAECHKNSCNLLPSRAKRLNRTPLKLHNIIIFAFYYINIDGNMLYSTHAEYF